MTHLGDITKIDWFHVPPVDVVTGGSPCQDLSVAGKRAGLAGERSGLYMEQIRCVKELRQADEQRGRTGFAIRPRYMVWENVPGSFSSNGGEDFRAVLEEAAKIAQPNAVIPQPPKGKWTNSGAIVGDGWSIAWRVHDAQFWGVPQRRRRISVVCDFGGLSAPEVLFERKGLSGDFEPGGTPGEETAGGTRAGTEGASGEVAATITATYGTKWNGNAGAYNGQNFVIEGADNVSGCLKTQPHGVCETISFQERGGKPGGGKGILIQREHVGALSTLNNQSVLAYRFEPGAAKRMDTENRFVEEKTPTLRANMGDNQTSVLCLNDQGGSVMGVSHDVTGSLRAQEHGHQPVVTAYGISSYDSNAMKSPNPHSGIYEADTARTLDLNGGSPACNQGGIAVVQSAVYDARGNGDGKTVCTITGDHENSVTDYTALCVGNGQANQSVSDKAGALNTMHDQQAVMVSAVDCRNLNEHQEVSGTLQCKQNGGYSLNYQNPIKVQGAYNGQRQSVYGHSIVRRLTPLEAERLQGYPDGWTDIGEWTDSKGKKHKPADSPRYKALGNSIALPFWFWLLRRISAQYIGPATLGSLFDGISGFCYVWARCNGSKSCLWASEIEEFPIAVCKRHFGDEESGEVGDILEYL